MKKIISLLIFLFFVPLFGDNVLITGANSGIGLALVNYFLKKGDRVFATYRTYENSQELFNIENPNLIKIKIDILINENHAKLISRAIGSEPIDIIIHNAGFFPFKANKMPDFDQQECIASFMVHSIAPIYITWELFPNLKISNKKTVIWITSRRGSLSLISEDKTYQGRYAYTMAKAAANMAGIQLAKDLAQEVLGSKLFLIHPDRVATKLTGYDGIAPEESAKLIAEFIETSATKESGTFWDVSTGKKLPF